MLPKDLRKRALTFAVVFPCAMAAIMFRAIMLPLGIIIVCIAIDEYHRTTRAYAHRWTDRVCSFSPQFIPIFVSSEASMFGLVVSISSAHCLFRFVPSFCRTKHSCLRTFLSSDLHSYTAWFGIPSGLYRNYYSTIHLIRIVSSFSFCCSVNNVIEETFHRLCSDMFGQFYISFLWGHAFLLANKPYATPVLMYIILVTSTLF
jgi:hypothetical protein